MKAETTTPPTQATSDALISHGIDLILDAVERLATKPGGATPSDRDSRYAVLHLAIGAEVLFKSALLREHWSLVFEKSDGASLASLASGDFRSVALPGGGRAQHAGGGILCATSYKRLSSL